MAHTDRARSSSINKCSSLEHSNYLPKQTFSGLATVSRLVGGFDLKNRDRRPSFFLLNTFALSLQQNIGLTYYAG